MRSVRCRRCKQMFEFEGLPPECCPRCKKIEDNQFMRVRELVRDHPGITALEVHEHTGVPFPTIMQYIEKGHLEIVPGDPHGRESVEAWLSSRRMLPKGTQTKYSEPTEEEPQDEGPDFEILTPKQAKLRFHDENLQ